MHIAPSGHSCSFQNIFFFFSFHGKMKILYSRNIEKEFVGEEIQNLIENAIIIFGGKI